MLRYYRIPSVCFGDLDDDLRDEIERLLLQVAGQLKNRPPILEPSLSRSDGYEPARGLGVLLSCGESSIVDLVPDGRYK